MRILHIIATINPVDGGPIEGVRQIGEIMAREGVTQEVLCLDPAGAPWLAGFGRAVHALGNPRPQGNGYFARFKRWANYTPQARDWARQHVSDYDVVVVNGLWNYATRMARLALVGNGVPYLVYAHGMLDPWFRKRYPLKHAVKQLLWWFNEGVLLRRADRVMFTCEQERLLARKTFIPYRVNEHVVAYGAGTPPPAQPGDEAAFRAMVPALGDRRYLLFLSRIHEKKGCDLLIEAFARQAGRDPGLDLVIAGPDQEGLRASLESAARRLGVAERIHWPGMVKGGAKYGALRAAEAFILPSHQENFGIAVAEALACNCPVLISDQVNIWREILEGQAGLVAPNTADGTESLIARFLDLTAEQRVTMRRQAGIVFAQRFDMERGALEFIAVAREVSRKGK